jgi:hypothetical protein
VATQRWGDHPERWLDAPPAWVRWTTGVGLAVIMVEVLVPYAWWVRLAVVTGLVLTAGVLHHGHDG